MTRGNGAWCCALLGCGLALATTVRALQLPTAVGSVTSETAPVTIYYARAEKADVAAALLPAAEQAWATQVEQLGFSAPSTLNDDLQPMPGMRFYLVQSSSFAGHALPVADLPETPQTDCASITLIADNLPLGYLATVVEHEFNHAVVMATDCIEGFFALEMTAVAVTTLLHPNDDFLGSVLPDFQQHPDYAIYSVTGSNYFHFGSALFGLFLDQRYGASDGQLLAQVWARTAQPGTVIVSSQGYATSSANNVPNLLHAIGSVLADQGATLEQALAEFASYRFFVGSLDDGNHLAGANRWVGAEPRFDARYGIDQLPVWDAVPSAPPQDSGASYIAIDLAGTNVDQRLRLSLAADPGVAWHASAIGLGPDGATEIELPIDADGYGTLTVDQLERFDQLVLVVANLGNGTHSVDSNRGVASDFYYSVELLDCPPVALLGANPAALEPGTRHRVRIAASGLPDQPFALRIAGDGVGVVDAVRLSSTEIDATLEVAAGAAPGARDLTIDLDCGGSAVGSGLIRIQDASVGCAAIPAGDHSGALALLLALELLRRRATR